MVAPFRVFTDHPTLLAKRASNHPPNLPPIIGRRLNRSSCRSYIKVPSDHQRSGVILTSLLSPPLAKALNVNIYKKIAWRKNIPHEEVFRDCPIFGIFFDSWIAAQDKQIDMRCCLSEASSSNDYENRTIGL